MSLDLISVFLSTALTDFRLIACASALSELSAYRDLGSSLGLIESLGISVDSDILYIIDSRLYHTVNGISAAAANTDYFYIYIGFQSFLIIEI